MTQNKQFKLEVRRYAEEHGLAYADARRRILAARSVRTYPDTVKAVLSAGAYEIPGMSAEQVEAVKPMLDVMNAPSARPESPDSK